MAQATCLRVQGSEIQEEGWAGVRGRGQGSPTWECLPLPEATGKSQSRLFRLVKAATIRERSTQQGVLEAVKDLRRHRN